MNIFRSNKDDGAGSERESPKASAITRSAEAVDEIIRRSEQSVKAVWLERVGGYLEQMLSSREKAIESLGHQNPDIRITAFHILFKIWPPMHDVLPVCLRAISEDANTDVRIYAIHYIAALYFGTRDQCYSAILANLVLDKNTEVDLKEAAYLGILRINSLPLPRELIRNVKKIGDRVPFPLDLEFAARFCKPKEN